MDRVTTFQIISVFQLHRPEVGIRCPEVLCSVFDVGEVEAALAVVKGLLWHVKSSSLVRLTFALGRQRLPIAAISWLGDSQCACALDANSWRHERLWCLLLFQETLCAM